MKISVKDQSGRVFNIEIDPTDNIFVLKGKVSRVAGGGNVHQTKIFFNGKELDNFSNMIQNEIKEGAQLTVTLPNTAPQQAPQQTHHQPQQNPFSAFGGFNANAGAKQMNQPNFMSNPNLVSQAVQLKEAFVNDPAKLNSLLEKDPELAQALLSDSIEEAVQVIGVRVGKVNEASKATNGEDEENKGGYGARFRSL